MMLLLVSILTLAMFYMTSLMGYIFILLMYVSLIMIWLSSMMFTSELVSLMILLVYVGAMSVLFLYVSAVSPNNPPLPSNTLKLLGLLIIFGYSVSSILSSSFFMDLMNYNMSTSDEMFSGLGIILITCLVFILILVLAATTFMSPLSSTFRSISVVGNV